MIRWITLAVLIQCLVNNAVAQEVIDKNDENYFVEEVTTNFKKNVSQYSVETKKRPYRVQFSVLKIAHYYTINY